MYLWYNVSSTALQKSKIEWYRLVYVAAHFDLPQFGNESQHYLGINIILIKILLHDIDKNVGKDCIKLQIIIINYSQWSWPMWEYVEFILPDRIIGY